MTGNSDDKKPKSTFTLSISRQLSILVGITFNSSFISVDNIFW